MFHTVIWWRLSPKHDAVGVVFLYLYFVPFNFFAVLFSPPPSGNSDPGSRSRLFAPLLITGRALHFYHEKNSALSCLVDSCRNAPSHARRSQQLIVL